MSSATFRIMPDPASPAAQALAAARVALEEARDRYDAAWAALTAERTPERFAAKTAAHTALLAARARLHGLHGAA